MLAAASPTRVPQSPAQSFGPLYAAVEEAHVFADGKTFADAVPKRSPAAILTDYRAAHPSGKAALAAFVAAYFEVPQGPSQPEAAPARLPLKAHIARLWNVLRRPPLTPVAGSSALALPAPYVVPGGRFREIYYWDSYFTMLGLTEDKRDDLTRSMIADFESLIERYGRIPNGTRTYYLRPIAAAVLRADARSGTAGGCRRCGAAAA